MESPSAYPFTKSEVSLLELVAKNAIKNILKSVVTKDTVINARTGYNPNPCTILDDNHKQYISYSIKNRYIFRNKQSQNQNMCFCVGNNKAIHEYLLSINYYNAHNPEWIKNEASLTTLCQVLNNSFNKDINKKLNEELDKSVKYVLDEKLYNYLLAQSMMGKINKHFVSPNTTTKVLLNAICLDRSDNPEQRIVPIISISKNEIITDQATTRENFIPWDSRFP